MQFKTKTIILVVSISLFLFTLSAVTVQAIPTLQLYIPNSEYDPETESWMVYANEFELQVLGASKNGNVKSISGLSLYIAVPEDWLLGGGSVTVTGPEGYDQTTLNFPGTLYGTPTKGNKQLPPHGTYPTYYHELLLPIMDMESQSLTTINNYNPGEDGEDLGIIYTYDIEYKGVFGIHMDAAGIETKKNGKTKSVFAPFSHDADAVTPEPSTFILISIGLIVLVCILYRSKHQLEIR